MVVTKTYALMTYPMTWPEAVADVTSGVRGIVFQLDVLSELVISLFTDDPPLLLPSCGDVQYQTRLHENPAMKLIKRRYAE